MSLSLGDVDIEKFTVAERLDLIALLWESIPDSLEVLPVPEWHRELLDQRLAAADARPEESIPWEQVKARLREMP